MKLDKAVKDMADALKFTPEELAAWKERVAKLEARIRRAEKALGKPWDRPWNWDEHPLPDEGDVP